MVLCIDLLRFSVFTSLLTLVVPDQSSPRQKGIVLQCECANSRLVERRLSIAPKELDSVCQDPLVFQCALPATVIHRPATRVCQTCNQHDDAKTLPTSS